MKKFWLWILFIIVVSLLCTVIWVVVNSIGNNEIYILQFIQTVATVLALVGVIIAWKSFKSGEEVRKKQIDKLEDIALTSERQLKVLEQSLEDTREINNLLQLSTTKETEPEKEKILEQIVAIEKERRRKAIMPKFVKKGWSKNWIHLINIGEAANDIRIQLFKGTDMTKKPQIINTFAPNEYIEKKERLRIRLDAKAVPNIFTLLIIFKDSDGIRYSQIIRVDHLNLEIDEPSRYHIVQK